MTEAADRPPPHAPAARCEFVYLILAHHKIGQLVRLLRTIRLGSPSAAILLHHDSKSAPPDPGVLSDLDVTLVEPRVSIHWGDASHIDAVLAGLAFALRRIDFDWLTLLSGQDFPLRPLVTIEAELRAADCDAFVRAGPVETEGYRERYYLRYRRLPRFPYAHRLPGWLRAAGRRLLAEVNRRQDWIRTEGGLRDIGLLLGVRANKHPFGDAFVCFKGSDWFTLNRRAAAYVLEFERRRPDVLAYYRQTFLPSESYFQTILWNAPGVRVRNDHRRFILWDPSRLAHPVTLTTEHFRAMTASGKDFGRKFDESVDSEVLGALERVVLGYPIGASSEGTVDYARP